MSGGQVVILTSKFVCNGVEVAVSTLALLSKGYKERRAVCIVCETIETVLMFCTSRCHYSMSHLVPVAGIAATVPLGHNAILVFVVGNVVVTSMTSGLYVVQPDYAAMEAAATNKTYGEQTRWLKRKMFILAETAFV